MATGNLPELIQWYAEKIGVQILAACVQPGGFDEVFLDDTGIFYGVLPKPDFDASDLSTEISQQEAINRGLLIGERFVDNFWHRMITISKDKLSRSQDPNQTRAFKSEFYNGHLIRFMGLKTALGANSPTPFLNIQTGRTSHFTSVATTQTLNGYSYLFPVDSSSTALPLPNYERWVGKDWKTKIKHSCLANTLSIQLMLYNDKEIMYVKRGKVGINAGVLSATISGVLEIPNEEEQQELFWLDPIGYTARKECFEELNLEIDANKIEWLACAVTLAECRVSLLGIYKTEYDLDSLKLKIPEAISGYEVEKIHSLPIKYQLKNVKKPSPSDPILHDITELDSIGDATILNILYSTKGVTIHQPINPPKDKWHELGALTLLLTIIVRAYTIPSDGFGNKFESMLQMLKVKIEELGNIAG